MTLICSLRSQDTIWLLADRRLTYASGAPPLDDAVKIMILETPDGAKALLGYAGLGMTARGVQPSDWMSAVLRGRGGLTLEQSLGLISMAANRELPVHLKGLPVAAHTVVVPAFLPSGEARLYTIDNVVSGGRHSYRYTRHQHTDIAGSSSAPRLGFAGTGGVYLQRTASAWQRSLLRLANANDLGKASDGTVADALAKLNNEAHKNVVDGSVGPRCIVVWRRRQTPRRPGSGGGYRCYSGAEQEDGAVSIPSIMGGTDMKSMIAALMPEMQIAFDEALADDAIVDLDVNVRAALGRVTASIAKLPATPDERLR